MPASHDRLRARLSHVNEITITVTGRKSGRSISIPIWFVHEDGTLNLLPVQGSQTQWYQNILKSPRMTVDAGGEKTEVQAVPITDPKQVSAIAEEFRGKYGASDVKKYYSKFDVAVQIRL